MREETIRLADDSIFYVVINPINEYGYESWNGSNDKLNVKEISKLVYEEMLVEAEDVCGYSRAIRFDGKKNIMKYICDRLLEVMKLEGLGEHLDG